ncbi:MAG: Ig-like domain-containing protein [Chloroflexi bacterium]|nr:Ig-like domain-containing protein [Chloroflexota bacterium]
MRRYILLLFVLLSLGTLLTACGAPQPTPTPAPTFTPLPPQPPKVIARSPERGQEHDVKAPIVLTFDQPMDPASVEKAFRITPQVSGTFKWEGTRLFFTPAAEGFARATSYRVTLEPTARSAAGLPLADAFSFKFSTVGYLEVATVQPAPGTTGVAPDATITVMFNRPVVPLSDIQSQTGFALRQPLRFAPPISGEGKWLNTSIYTFQASPGFLPGTTFQVTVDPDRLADLTEAVMPEPYTWEFTTALPEVSAVTTSDPEEYIGLSPTISITFNMLMDHPSVEQRFALQPASGGASIPGTFTWDGKTVGFTPSTPLQLDTGYVVAIAPGARASIGGEGMAHAFEWRFRTIPAPRIVRTSPANGAKDVEPYTSLEVTFSSPINRDSLLPNLTILPKPTEVYTSWWNADTQLHLSFGAKPSTTYTITFGADLEGRYGHKLGQSYRITFTTKALPPAVYFPMDRVGTYNAYTTTAIYVQHVNISELDLALYRLDRADFILLNSGEWWNRWEKYAPKPANLIRKWTKKVESELNTYQATVVPLAADGESPLLPGFYYLEVHAPGVREPARHMLVVSYANVLLKVTMKEALVWVTDLDSGKPVSGLDVAVFGPEGQVLASGRTDKDGVLFSALTLDKPIEPWKPILAIVGPDEAPAAVSTDWSRGISPWQFNIPTEEYLEPYHAYFYTDRSIYRPGQTVYFKGIVRRDDDGRYSLPTDVKSISVVVYDDEGKEIYRSDHTLNDMGTLHGEFKLGDEASLGYYYLNAQLGEQTFGTNFQVAEYRKPEFVVTVTPDRDEYVQGDQITVDIAASYYFGGPVANAKVTWRLMSQDYYFNWTGKERYDFTDADYESRGKQTFYGELLSEGKGITNSDGHLILKIPADIATRKNSQVFTIEASVTDPSNQEVSGRNSAIVHKGFFYIGLAPLEYIGSVGRESKIKAITVNPKSEPVANVPLTVVFLEQKWYNVQTQAADGRFYWEWKLEETPVYTTTATTDAAGTAIISFTPEKGGAYRVRAFARDQRENEIRASTYIWISSSTFIPWRQENNDRIELVTDKKSYRPGETARILIPSPFQGKVQALLTVERGHILSHRLLTLSSNSEQVEVPILSEYAPNAYISVVIVKGVDATNPVPSYRVGYVNLDISTEEKELKVQIVPDKKTPYQPASKATFEVLATDYRGRGVEAELSLQLVDLSVLALTDSRQGTMLDSFYRKRGLGVRTGSTLAISVDRYRQQTQPPTGKGGSGREAVLEDAIRKRFLDTAYWNAEIRTDAQGRAKVTVDLPDNLTTWRATAKAVTADTLVGDGNMDIVTSKDLLVRSVAPRFFVLGDQAQLGAVVHNNTDQALVVDASLEGEGVAIENASQRIQVPAHAIQSLTWPVRVTGSKSVVLTWRVVSGGLSDALQLTLPVYHYSTPEVVATAGQVPSGEARVETVLLPERLDPSQGELTIQLDPSLAAGMRDGLTYLETYPYDCIEQTVSRFLPNVITYRALKKLGMTNAELEAKLPQYVSLGLQRIYALQHYDGGWGWWLADDSNPFISAYVLLGMNEAARAGFAVDSQVMDRAAKYLLGTLDSAQTERQYGPNTRAFVLYVLAEYGQGDLGRTIALFDKRATLANYGKAYLLMALRLLEPKEESRVKTLLSELTNAAILSATGAHWEEEQVDHWTMNTDTRTTAIVLEALLRADPANALIPNIVRWLMAVRREGHWETTQETAWAIMALTDFMATTGELQADYDYQVVVNGKRLGQGTVTAQDVGQTRKLLVAVRDLLREESNRIVLERAARAPQTGKGQLYYSLYLRYFLPVEDVKALNRGVIVSRQYTLLDKPDQPITAAKVGDVIRVKLTIIAPNNLHYLVVEDPLPAGCEALDISLKTTSAVYQMPTLKGEEEGWWHPYWWYFTESELRDEKVALFATYLDKGTYEYTYLIRASIPGRFLTMPAFAYEMYFPEVFGRSDGLVFTIE